MGNESARRLRNTARKSRRNQKGGEFNLTDEQRKKLEAIENETKKVMLDEANDFCDGIQLCIDEKKPEISEAATKARNEYLSMLKKEAKAAETADTEEAERKEEEEKGGKRRHRRRGRKTARKSRRKGRKSGRKSRRRSRR